MLKTQRWKPDDTDTFFDEVFDWAVDPPEFVECTQAVVNGVTRPNPAASHFAYKQSHVQANPAWASLNGPERAAVMQTITPRLGGAGALNGGGQGNGPQG
jgi:hypothetical protein